MKEVKFKELFDYQKKSKIKAGDGLSLSEGKYPFFTSSNTLSKSLNEFLFTKTSLIFGTGGVPSIHFCETEFAVSTDCLVAQPKADVEIFVKYFYYFFIQNDLRVLADGFKGAGLKHISRKYIDEIKIPLPPLTTQKRIASSLDKAAALRDKTQQLLTEYDQLAQSIFLEMFGDPILNDKNWSKKRFDELVSESCPLTYGIVQPGEDVDEGVPCVRPVDLTKQYISVDKLKKIDSLISDKFSRTILKGGEILLSVRGSVGVISIADTSLNGANVTRGIVPIWFDEKVSNKKFFYYLYKTSRIQNQVKRLARGATLIQINLKDLRELKLIQPPIVLQNQFAEKIGLIEQQKALAKQELQQSEDLFNCLLQKAFKGELV